MKLNSLVIICIFALLFVEKVDHQQGQRQNEFG